MNKRPEKPILLMIDDEERILRSLGILFKQTHRVFKTSSPEEFLEVLKREYVHVIISDQRMPKAKGTDLLRQAKAISPHSIRILLTGYADIDAVMASINEGEIFRYLTKPWDPNELKRTVTKATQIAVKIQKKSIIEVEAEETGSTVPDSFSLDDLESAVQSLAKELDFPKSSYQHPTERQETADITDIKGIDDTETDTTEIPATNVSETDDSRIDDVIAETAVTVETISSETPNKEKILVINDSTTMHSKVKKLFADKHDVLYANNLEDAVDYLVKNTIAVTISDTKLGGIDIAPVIKTLKRTSPELVSIVITSFQDTGMLIDLINEGQIFRCLPNPVSATMLEKSVQHAISQHHLLRNDSTEILRHPVEEIEQYNAGDKSSSNISSFIDRLRSKLGE